MLSKTKDHAVHVGPSLQLLPLKELLNFQPEPSITFQNRNLLIVLVVFMEMRDVMEDGWMKLSNTSFITKSPLNHHIHIQEKMEHADLHPPRLAFHHLLMLMNLVNQHSLLLLLNNQSVLPSMLVVASSNFTQKVFSLMLVPVVLINLITVLLQ